MHTFWKKKKKPCDLRSFSWFFHPFKAELGSHCCIFRDVSIFISGLHGRWWHGFGTWTKQERSDRLLVMSSLCLGKATETDYFPDFSFFPYFTFFFSFFFPFSFQTRNPTFTLTVRLELHILATLSLKVAGDPHTDRHCFGSMYKCQLSLRGFCAASHWLLLL